MPTTIELPPQSIHGAQDRHNLPPFATWSGIFEHRVYTSHMQSGVLVFEIFEQADADKKAIDQQYAADQQSLKTSLDTQVQQLAGNLDNLLQHEVLERQDAATQQLLLQKSAALPAAQQTALQFFGESPLAKSAADYVRALSRPHGFANPRQTWLASYRAAHEAKLLAGAIDYLNIRTKALTVARKVAAHEVKQAEKLEKSIRTVDLLLAQMVLAKHEHQVSAARLQEHLDAFSRHEFETLTSEHLPLHGKALEDELAQLLQAHKANNKTHYNRNAHPMRLSIHYKVLETDLVFARSRNTPATSFEIGRGLVQASVQALAEHELARAETFRLHREYSTRVTAAITATNTELARLATLAGSEIPQRPYTYRLPLSATTQAQVITPAAASMAAFARGATALGVALQAARPLLVGPPRLVLEVASLLLFSFRLDHGDRYGISSPLKELLPDFKLQDVVERIGQHLELPIRLLSGMVGENSHVQVVPTNVDGVPSAVPVRQATWDGELGAYRFVTDGPGPITVLWTPETRPGDSSTTLPTEEQSNRLYPGIISVPSTPKLLTFPATADLHFSDYIVTFPADSGLEPVYIMFKNPRDHAGAGTGTGQTIPDWQRAAVSAAGAPIPTNIADQLRDRPFGNWGKMREAIWRAVAEDPELSKHFSKSNIQRMLDGAAPFVPASERVGRREVFELHHIHPIAEGGAVYDVDNLVVMTPKNHIAKHGKKSQ
ncbi:S-type pyocin domain-containing protein [Pseudomonas japonica]|uniref:S-type Pyocin n=1 Tax=Pseudomonas japonica TaxID=256466 RepID=A0A239CDA7_9PSED|nr:S-type pyocin domain-containing protein [Pseudomonas japonica]SNS17882.1 S-type Pyocin [Pseudomonas japonica]